MPEPTKLEKAQLKEVQLNKDNTVESDFLMYVQFNPETLKVNLTNAISNKEGKDQQKSSAIQYMATSTTKLTFDLWFDATVTDEVDDVRRLTEKVAYFMKPKKTVRDKEEFKPPGVRFVWGSFLFDGIMDSINENLEYFSPEGRPLRAGLSISITQQRYQYQIEPIKTNIPVKQAGVERREEVKKGETLQENLAKLGLIKYWPLIAALNDLDNARQIPEGTSLNISIPLK